MKFEIKHRWNGSVLFSLECESLKLCVEAAIGAKADLTSADLRYAKLRSADLRYADLTSADLRYAKLTSADLTYADLTSADLTSAKLTSAKLTCADLTSADLTSADLRYAKLRSADLTSAKLRCADLTCADLTSADLTSADLTYADLTDKSRLSTGETFGEYKSLVIPALCTAGGKSLEKVAGAWDCHSWSNCPMQAAFDFDGNYKNASALVKLHRPRIEQFVQLFDAGLLPCPVAAPTSCDTPAQS